MIELKNVSKSFYQADNEIQILEGLNSTIESKGLLSIVGKSGSGKSTLLSLLGGLDQASSGEIIINGANLSEMDEKELTAFRANNIGIIFQNFHLIDSFTALENVLLPLEVLKIKNPIDKARDILNRVGLGHRENHFPRQLSGGESQRVAIARAMVTNPKLLLADEPSGNLDQETGESVMSILFKTARDLGQTLVLVTHDLELAKKCDRQFILKDHSLAEL